MRKRSNVIEFFTFLVFVLTCIAWVAPASSSQPKPISLHPDNSHYLLFRGKPTILITSGEHYGAVLNLDFDYVTYLDELKSHGLNLTRTFSGTYREVPSSFGITDNTLAPKRYCSPWLRSSTPGAVDGDKFDLTKWNDSYFNRLRDFVLQASGRGVVVEFVLFCPFYDDNLWNVNPMKYTNNINNIGDCPRTEVYTLKHQDLLKIHDAFVRKAVAELNSFDNLYFEICNEPYFGGVTEDWQAHIAQTIADAEKNLPNKHLIAQNIANGVKKIDKPNSIVSIFNFHYAVPPDTVAQNYHLNKVIADDETGFRGKDDVTYRTEGWGFIIAGGAVYSSLDYSFTPAHPAGTLRDYKSPGGGSSELRDQLGILLRFMESFDFLRMSPNNNPIKGGWITAPLGGTPAQANATVRVLAESGKAYAIYINGGTEANLTLDIPAGNYTTEWLNTKTSKIDKTEKLTHKGGNVTLRSPEYVEDIALRLLSQ